LFFTKEICAMTFKIERDSSESRPLFRLSGRIEGSQLEELKRHIAANSQAILDLQELKLVDRDVVLFLHQCETNGVELRNCPPYVREWIVAEIARQPDHKPE
jgi:hypothetical protein